MKSEKFSKEVRVKGKEKNGSRLETWRHLFVYTRPPLNYIKFRPDFCTQFSTFLNYFLRLLGDFKRQKPSPQWHRIIYLLIMWQLRLISFHRILSGVPAGSFSRWAFGVIILTHLVAYNECGSVGTLVAVIIATLNSLLMGRSSRTIDHLISDHVVVRSLVLHESLCVHARGHSTCAFYKSQYRLGKGRQGITKFFLRRVLHEFVLRWKFLWRFFP